MEKLPVSLGEKLGFLKQERGFATRAIHSGQEPEQWKSRAIVPPIVTSTTYSQISPGENAGYRYSRYENPTRNALEKCLASLDNAKYAVVFNAGVGALTAMMTMFKSGDNLVSSKKFYAGDFLVWDIFSRLGVEVRYIDFENLKNLEAALDGNTKLVFIETPTNPTLINLDIQKIADIVHKKSKALFAVDNTFLTPYFQRPLELGADIAMYSMSKFFGGHSDIIGGSISTNNKEIYDQLRASSVAIGVGATPFNSYLINRSIRTLAVRMEKHFENSYGIANFLNSHPKIQKVNHPALENFEGYELARKQSYGHSGIFSFYIKNGTLEMSQKFFKSLKLIYVGESLGGTETLASFPYIMSHSSMPEDERIKAGVTANLIRLSVGLEDVRDLIEDIECALKEI